MLILKNQKEENASINNLIKLPNQSIVNIKMNIKNKLVQVKNINFYRLKGNKKVSNKKKENKKKLTIK